MWGPIRVFVLCLSTLIVSIVIFYRGVNDDSHLPLPSQASDGLYKLGVCYSGQVRAFRRVYEQNYQTFRSFDPTVHFLVNVDLQDSIELPSGSRFVHNHTEAELEDAFALMNVSNASFYTSQDIPIPPRPKHCTNEEEVHRYRVHYKNFYAARACYKMLQAHELKTGRKFAWVLHIRPGIYVDIRRPPAHGAAMRQIHMSGYDVALIPRNLGGLFFDTIHVYDKKNCRKLQEADNDACGNSYVRDTDDCLTVRWLEMHGHQPTSSVYVNHRIVVEERFREMRKFRRARA